MRQRGSGCLFAASLVVAGQLAAQSAQYKLTLLDAPVLIVDPACTTCDGGSAVLQFRNDTPGKVTLALTASEVATPAGKRSGATVALQPVTDLAGKTAAGISMADPGKFVYIRADVQNILQDGEWEIEIHNHGTNIGKFKMIRAPVSFNVKLDVPNPDAPELSLRRGVPKFLAFGNGDDRAYPVSWEFAIDGKQDVAVSPPDQADKTKSDSGLTLPARGAGQVAFVPPGGWFSLKGILKDETVDGRLTVRLRRMDCASQGLAPSPDAPAKTFKVKVHLASCSPGCQTFWADVFIFVTLLLGAAASFLVNLVVPNYIRRRDFRRRLIDVEAGVASLPVALSSRLRVPAGIERKSLEESVNSLPFFGLEFKGRITELEQLAKQLDSRVNLLQRMGAGRIRFEALRAEASPPTLVDGIEDLFEDLVRSLDSVGLATDVLNAANVKVAEIEKRMDDLHKAGPDFARQLVDRAAWLTREFANDPHAPVRNPIGQSATADRMRAALPGLFDQLRIAPTDPNNLTAADYAKWDMILYKLDLIRKYVNWREGGQRPDRAAQYGAIEAELVKRLLLFSWEGLNSARRYVLEIEQNIFLEDIETQIQNRRVRLRKDRFAVRRFAPTQFYLEFEDPAYNTAEAKQDWTCFWYFDHGAFVDPHGPFVEHAGMMREYGWVVSHYFADARSYWVWVRLHRQQPNGAAVLDALDPRPIHVGGAKEMDSWKKLWGIEVVQLFVAILPALVGLVAGAKDQVLKLDLIPAAIAIFMIGFGSDQIKNKLIQ